MIETDLFQSVKVRLNFVRCEILIKLMILFSKMKDIWLVGWVVRLRDKHALSHMIYISLKWVRKIPVHFIFTELHFGKDTYFPYLNHTKQFWLTSAHCWKGDGLHAPLFSNIQTSLDAIRQVSKEMTAIHVNDACALQTIRSGNSNALLV